MKNLKELGIILSKTEQKSIHGGVYACGMGYECPPGYCCPVDPNSGSQRACFLGPCLER